jgi:hypothetical protein
VSEFVERINKAINLKLE